MAAPNARGTNNVESRKRVIIGASQVRRTATVTKRKTFISCVQRRYPQRVCKALSI